MGRKNRSAAMTASCDSSTTSTETPVCRLMAPAVAPPPSPITSAVRGSGWTAIGRFPMRRWTNGVLPALVAWWMPLTLSVNIPLAFS